MHLVLCCCVERWPFDLRKDKQEWLVNDVATKDKKEITYNPHNYFAPNRIVMYGAIGVLLPSN